GAGPEFRQGADGAALPCLCGGVDRGDALAMAPSAEGPAPVGVGAELDEGADRGFVAVDRGPDERRAAEGVCVDAGAVLDEPADRFDAVGLGGPDERLVEDLAGIVRGLPGGESAVGAIEAPVRAGLWRADQLVDQVEVAEPCGDAQVARLAAEEGGDLA